MTIPEHVKTAVIQASTTFRKDQFNAYRKALENETNATASWILELLIENAIIAEKNRAPLCDDTGIPHVLVEMGNQSALPINFMHDVRNGIEAGLRELPGRPMAVKGKDIERIEQKNGLHDDPGMVKSPLFLFDQLEERETQDIIRVHILMLGGGPEIRAKTHPVFHQRNYEEIFKEISGWMGIEIPKLGCTPCIPTIGIGRTQYEASALMLKAMAHGNLEVQSELEDHLTKKINSLDIGPLNMGGSITALGSFIKIGPQRASGVRILSMRPCCCMEPRVSSFDYQFDEYV